jgi:hypothetical protein
MLYPKIGIRPTIDGRWGGVRESLEDQTMAMARNAKALIEENLRYPDGTPVQCVIADSTIGGGAEAVRELFLRALLNYAASNRDDHGKNHGMLFDQAAGWRLAPAYDMLPMALAPNRQGDMRDSIPRPVQNSWVTPEIWAEMEAVAREYWARLGWGKA